MPNLRGFEWVVLVLLIVVLFGAKRLPDAARGLGRSLRIFKAETKGLRDDDAADPNGPAQTTTAQQVVPPVIAPVDITQPDAAPAPAPAPPAEPGAPADR